MGIAVLSERDRLLLQRQYAKPVWCLPDFRAGGHDAASLPIDSSITFEINNLACDRKIILMAGDISPRKGLVRFLELAASCQAENYFFVVAGALHEDAFTASDQQKIARAKSFSNLFIHPDRIASDREFDAVISQADILYAVYPDFDHSSNMLIHAAVNEIPIIVASGMEMGLRVEEYQLGATVDPGNIDEMKRALVRFSENDSSNAARFIAGCKAYRDFHTAKEFARGVLRICTTSSNNRR